MSVTDARSLFSVKLESPCFDVTASERFLFVVTTTCQARVYDVKSGKIVSSTTSVTHLADPDLASIDICDNGTPILVSTRPDAFAYDSDLQSWVPICEARLLEHDKPTGRGPQGVLSRVELQCVDSMKPTPNGTDTDLEWWSETQQIALLEMRIKAATLLGSRDEYRYWLSQYAVFLARQSFIGRADELLKELIGPLYQYVSPLSAHVNLLISLDIQAKPIPGKLKCWISANAIWPPLSVRQCVSYLSIYVRHSAKIRQYERIRQCLRLSISIKLYFARSRTRRATYDLRDRARPRQACDNRGDDTCYWHSMHQSVCVSIGYIYPLKTGCSTPTGSELKLLGHQRQSTDDRNALGPCVSYMYDQAQ